MIWEILKTSGVKPTAVLCTSAVTMVCLSACAEVMQALLVLRREAPWMEYIDAVFVGGEWQVRFGVAS